MRSIQEIFNVVMDSGNYNPNSGIYIALMRTAEKGEITVEECFKPHKELVGFDKTLPNISLILSIFENYSVTYEEAEELCFKIYRNWDQRFKILEELKS